MIKVIKKNSTHNSAIHPRPKEVMVFLHYKDKILQPPFLNTFIKY